MGIAGLPWHIIPLGRSLKTELLAPTTDPYPIRTPGATNTSVANHTWSSISIGSAKMSNITSVWSCAPAQR